MERGTVLVVDDEPNIADLIDLYLSREGFRVVKAGTGEGGVRAVTEHRPRLVVLDVGLPDIDGLEVCRRLRQQSSIPVIFLTARDGEIDRVLGLELGADDYVTKPFSLAELVSRVRAILRRRELDRNSRSTTTRAFGGLRIDLTMHTVEIDEKPVHLTPSEFRLLALLAATPGRVRTRREIMQHLWQSSYVGDERACDVHVSNLRRKIEPDPARPTRLVTVRGVGYRLLAV